MENPFMYGKPVEGEFYFDLPYLKREMQDFIDSKINVLVMGPRRSGKTSFLKSFLKVQRSRQKVVIDIDAFNVLSHKDFLNQLVNALKREKTGTQKFFEWLRGAKDLSPVFKWESNPHSGEVEYSINFSKLEESDTKQAILSTLSGLKALQNQHGVIISIDEFQRIGELEDGGWLEATLRSIMQELPEIAYVFTGSRRSILEDMFNNSKRPFYKSCKQINFPAFGPEFSAWLIERFKKANVTASPESIHYLREKVADTPNYVQEACFHLVSHGIKHVTGKEIDEILDIISSQGSYSYEALLNTLTSVQIKFLRLFIGEGKVDYSKEVLKRYEIKTGSNLQAAAKALVDKQIIIKEPGGSFTFDDPMFKIWLNKKLILK
ncbi:MAG: ATP-binding protein [Bdellovibrionaceae bacterium]|nr:ATP-binding protein [Pseudobdellovibrionaceae bacterium]MBX3032881.1 ATP-binding protein [Pseudobdellovibrionaceae bacterium]